MPWLPLPHHRVSLLLLGCYLGLAFTNHLAHWACAAELSTVNTPSATAPSASSVAMPNAAANPTAAVPAPQKTPLWHKAQRTYRYSQQKIDQSVKTTAVLGQLPQAKLVLTQPTDTLLVLPAQSGADKKKGFSDTDVPLSQELALTLKLHLAPNQPVNQWQELTTALPVLASWGPNPALFGQWLAGQEAPPASRVFLQQFKTWCPTCTNATLVLVQSEVDFSRPHYPAGFFNTARAWLTDSLNSEGVNPLRVRYLWLRLNVAKGTVSPLWLWDDVAAFSADRVQGVMPSVYGQTSAEVQVQQSAKLLGKRMVYQALKAKVLKPTL